MAAGRVYPEFTVRRMLRDEKKRKERKKERRRWRSRSGDKGDTSSHEVSLVSTGTVNITGRP